MTFDFTVKEFILGGGTGLGQPFQFYRRGFNLGGSAQPSWKDIIISGIGSLTLVNAKANGLNYVKLFGGTELAPETYIDSVTLEGKCEQNGTPTPTNPVDIVCNNGVLGIDNQGNITATGTVETVTDSNQLTATAQPLLSVGDYKDTQEVLSGAITRNIGIKVIDGTENWQFVNTAYSDGTHRIYCNELFLPAINSSLEVISGYCTHFPINIITNRDVMNLGACIMWSVQGSVHLRATQFTTLAVAKQWLADQYANGTPVIVAYPVKTPTTETVSGQQLNKEPVTVTGSLTGLVANVVSSTHTTPKPTQPLDIVANNGIIKVKDDELPLGYKRLSYIESSGAQIIDTNYVLQETDSVEVDYNITNRSRTGDKFILGARPILDNPNVGMWVETYGSQNTWYVRFGSPNSVNVASTTSQLSGTLKVSKGSFVVNGVKILQPEFTGMSPNQMSIFNRRSSDGSVPTAGCSARVSSVRILNGNNIIRKYIPCESPDNILGLYEVTQGEFLTNNGDGDFTAGSYDTSHLTEIYYDGTVETVATKQAYVNDSDIVDRTGLNSNNGSTISNANRCYVLFPCKAGVTYTAQTDSADLIGGNFIEYRQPSATSANFIKSITATDDGLVGGVYKFHAVCDTDGWAGWQCKSNKATALANNWQITSDISTATAQPLLKVGTYQDVQSVLDGVVTRNVRVKVLNGSENWAYTISLLNYMYSLRIDDLFAEDVSVTSMRKTPYCTHFVRSERWVASSAEARNDVVQAWKPSSGSSVLGLGYNYPSADGLADFKAWLAEQYNAGTPVIVVYPVAEPTTESVAGQPMTIQAGTNVVEITQASIDNLELEVSYKAGVEVTVEEIEAVNNDESVEVTING